MTLKRLCNNCNVVLHENKLYLISYDLTIAVIENDTFTLGKHWNYSKTTLKHLYTFIETYSPRTTQVICNNIHKTKVQTIQRLIELNFFTYDESLI